MHPKPISLLTRRAEEIAISAHMLEERGIKPKNISITENYALICVDFTPAVKKLKGASCGATCVKGNWFFVFQVIINNVIVKWLEPYFDAQATAKKVH